MELFERSVVRVAGILALLLVSVACLGGGPRGGTVSGSIVGDGSSTVFPISEAIAEEFRIEEPRVQVTIGVSGTGGGFKKFCNGETDFQDASRPIKDEEKEACRAEGVEWIELTVANDGLAVIVNQDNTWVDCLTTQELEKIWRPGSDVENWKDVRDGFPDVELRLFGPGTDSGTFDYFTDVINGEEGASRTDYTASEDDNVLVKGVQGSDGGLGYLGFAYYLENKDALKVLAVDGGDGCVVPSDETVKSNTYAPLSRPLFLYVSKASLERPEMEAFMRFYLENANLILTDVGYTPLTEETLAEQQAELERAIEKGAA